MLSSFKIKIIRFILKTLNKVLPKYEQVVVLGGTDIEGNAFAVADYIGKHCLMSVYYTVSEEFISKIPPDMFNERVQLLRKFSLRYYLKILTSRYVFSTHNIPPYIYGGQKLINLWHGILYKRIRCLLGRSPLPANITVGTSELTSKMFAEAFGVPESSVLKSGYPRNDIMLRSKAKKNVLIQHIDEQLNIFNKIIVWLPTYRKNSNRDKQPDGSEVNNPFYIKDFDARRFNQLLKDHNTLCLLKPHPAAPAYQTNEKYKNLQHISDEWLSDHKITLYHLLACSDMLISDVSSVIIDYLLLDQPVVCMSEDFEEYKQTRGFYFDDIENWLPTKIIRKQKDFFNYLEYLLKNGDDPFKEKRIELKDKFFKYQDAHSTKRLVEHVFGLKDDGHLVAS